MSIQSLSPPQDIAWKRLAFSRDMIDTNFGDLKFPPKWRSSLAVYYFIVPEEETADEYPNSRIVYLRLTCSITGWNPNEELVNASGTVNVNPDEIQVSIWETITNDGWASVYWPCYGAIMQIAIYPPKDSIVGLDDYPEIMDFEPKKRELYESVTEGEEQLSSSSNKNSIGKSNTSTFSVEAELHATGPIGGALVGGGVKTGFGRQSVDTNNTDTSRENRETKSRTTSFSQMYQLFNGYHLGTNRAVFVVVPRPNIKSSEFILIDDSGGGRVLEGIQDVFLVVNIPKKLKGFCVQASIDTGHKVMANNMIAMENERQPNGEEEDPPIHPTNPGQPPNPDQTYQRVNCN